MVQRVLLLSVKQESAVFSPVLTRYGDFKIRRGAALVQALQNTATEIAGALRALANAGGIEVVPAFAAWSVSGGPVAQADLDRLLAAAAAAAAAAGRVDAAYLALHGAMAGEREDDPEGLLLRSVRSLLGPVPVVASVDLHAVLTDAMVALAEAIVPFHTYPHVDQAETGERAARVLLRLLRHGARPATARVPLPMLVRGDELITATGRFGTAIRMCRELEGSPRGLAAGVLIGNPFTDVPELRTNVLVTTDADQELAEQTAATVARFMWFNRHHFQARLTSIPAAIDIARRTAGLTVLADAADATSSGAPGDSNAILRALVAAPLDGRALLSLVDAPAVARAVAVGVGGRTEFTLGGTLDPNRHRPLVVTARVQALTDGRFRYADGTPEEAGRTAVLVIDQRVHVVVTERRVHLMDRSLYEAHGLAPAEFQVVVVKSPNGFRPHYESIAAAIVAVDAPGATSANLASLPYRRCPRPMFPLDPDVEPPPAIRDS